MSSHENNVNNWLKLAIEQTALKLEQHQIVAHQQRHPIIQL